MKKSALPLQVVHLEGKGALLVTNIKINGLPARMIVDSGASHTVFCKYQLHKFHVEFHDTDSGMQAMGLGEGFKIYQYRLEQFRIGKIILEPYSALVMNLSMLDNLFSKLAGSPIDGIAGSDLIIHPNNRLSYLKERIRWVGLRSKEFIKLSLVPGTVHLMVRIKIQNQMASLLLDTGASATIFNIHTFKRFFPALNQDPEPVDQLSAGINEKLTETGYANLEKVSLGHLEFTNLPARLINLSKVNLICGQMGLPPIHGLLGNDLLFDLGAEFDFGNLTLTLRG